MHHDHNHNNHHQQEKKGHNHGFMMLLCLIPMAALIILPRMGIELGPLGRLAPFAIFLICPLMHIGMFLMMRGHGDKNQGQRTQADTDHQGTGQWEEV